MRGKKQGIANFKFEKELWRNDCRYVVGMDEVGRGALAGPVVTGGVVFGPEILRQSRLLNPKSKILKGVKINDSKKLTARQREVAESWIRENALAVAVAAISARKIDRVGIVSATHSGFRRVVKSIQDQLGTPVHFILIDAFYIPNLRAFPLLKKARRQLAIKGGDEKSFTIAAASIVAKVYRDGLMTRLSERRGYKKYNWGQNKGYGTKAHQAAIKKYGLTGYHRKSFIHFS